MKPSSSKLAGSLSFFGSSLAATAVDEDEAAGAGADGLASSSLVVGALRGRRAAGPIEVVVLVCYGAHVNALSKNRGENNCDVSANCIRNELDPIKLVIETRRTFPPLPPIFTAIPN